MVHSMTAKLVGGLICSAVTLTALGAPQTRPGPPSPLPRLKIDDDLADAILDQDLGKINELLDAGASLEPPGGTPLCLAIGSHNQKIIDLLLSRGASPNGYGAGGCSALMVAVINGEPRVVLQLLELGAHPNPDGPHPLIAAALDGRSDLIIMLLKYGANIDATDSDGDTALQAAAFHGRLDAVKTLLAAGANPNTRNRFIRKPSYYVPKDSPVREEILRLLDKKEAAEGKSR